MSGDSAEVEALLPPAAGWCRAHVVVPAAGWPESCLFRARWVVQGIAVCGQHARCLARGTYVVWRGEVWPRGRLLAVPAQEG